jgi:peptidoglycan-associated lipoprotein
VPGPTPGTQEHLVVNVGDRVFFDFDRSDLRPEARATVEALAAWLGSYPAVTLTIEGHCDERGTREYNLALGERRANAVRDYLIALGVDAGRLNTISYGKERPAVLGSNEEAWAQNRRAVFVVN